MTDESDLLVAIDPGGTTGFVVVGLPTLDVLYSGELEDWYEVVDKVQEILLAAEELGKNPHVVIERFTINEGTSKKSPQSEPLDIIGAVKYLYHSYTGKELPQQTPADAKSFSTNDKLKKMGFWHVGGAGHANDAFRHALLYLIKRRLMDPKVLLD